MPGSRGHTGVIARAPHLHRFRFSKGSEGHSASIINLYDARRGLRDDIHMLQPRGPAPPPVRLMPQRP